MSVEKKIFVVTILLLISSFSGCTLLNRTEFKLISLHIEDDNGFASLSSAKIAVGLSNVPAGAFKEDIEKALATGDLVYEFVKQKLVEKGKEAYGA